MNEKLKKKKQKELIQGILIFIGIIIVTIILIIIFPDKKQSVLNNSWDFLLEMIMILPAVMLLMGLFSVWIPNETIGKYLGKSSGIKGMLIAFIFGALPTGPLYIVFPIAGTLLKKGASISNIVIFLSAWACIKIPQEIVEIQFLGIKFMLTRLILTITFISLMALLIQKLYPGEK
ncbi:MAG: permease, partial [Spirochaetes bacterium]|nr:permease [Spirochaetota bacterium]